MKSIHASQQKEQKQVPPLIHTCRISSKQDNVALAKFLLKELGINSQQFKTLFHNVAQGFALYKVVYDPKGLPIDFIPLECNQTYETIHSFKRDQIGKPVTEFYPKLKDTSVDWIEIYGNVALTGNPVAFETYCKSTDKWYLVYVYSPKNTYCISVFMDISKHKKRANLDLEKQSKWRQKLLYTEKRYRRLYETTQDGIMARDLQGQMIDCNLAYAKMLGYTRKELKALHPEQLIPEKWHKQRLAIIRKELQTGRSIVFEREYKRKDGSIFPASVRTWRLTDGKGKAIGTWSIVRDIGEQKKLQRSLEQHADDLKRIVEERTKQLKDSERLVAIGQTAGMVGHDLRNPLQTITGELYLAKSEIESLPEGKYKSNLQESIHVIEEQASYMDKIVSDLQAFVQPIKIDKKLVNLKDLISNVLLLVNTPDNVLKRMTVAKSSQVKADLYLLKRVLINLVTNSVQAMPNGGDLTVTGQIRGGQVVIAVRDTGVGIADSIKTQIFTPLFTTKPRGQGFGLAVCKRVIEAHGGTISFESKQGNGTKFVIQFPVA